MEYLVATEVDITQGPEPNIVVDVLSIDETSVTPSIHNGEEPLATVTFIGCS